MTEVPQLQQRPRWQQGLLDEDRTLGLAVSGKKASYQGRNPRDSIRALACVSSYSELLLPLSWAKQHPGNIAKNPVFLERTWITGQETETVMSVGKV